MALTRKTRWVVMSVLAIGVILGTSLLVGIQTAQAKRWVFGSGFTVQEVEVSETGDFFVTSSEPPDGAPRATVLHFFRADTVSWNATVPGTVTELALASSGALVAAGLDVGGIRLFTGRGNDLGTWPTQGPVRDLAVSADGGLVAAAAPLDRDAGERGGLLLYRLGKALPVLHVAMTDVQRVALSEDGNVLAAASGGPRSTQLRVWDRVEDEQNPRSVDTYPGVLTALEVSSDGRHILLVTEQAAFLLSRAHDRPVGMVPETIGALRYAGGALAPHGQSYLLLDHDRTTVSLHKWGETSPRWSASDDDGYTNIALDGSGSRAVVIDAGGHLAVLSVTTGRPIKELELAADARTIALSPNGAYVLAGDTDGRLYRAQSGYTGLLGALPDPIVSTLYAAPGFLLWSGVLAALMVLSAPVAAPLVRRFGPRLLPAKEPSPTIASEDPGPPAWETRRLDGPVVAQGLTVRKDDRTLLRAVDLVAAPGTVTAIVGGSGEGKSTLLRALLGHGISDGTVRLGGLDPRRDVRAVRDRAGFVAQDLQLYEALTPIENLLAFGGQFRADDPRLAQEASRLLRLVGLDPATDRPVAALSGGERRRVSIAATLLHAPGLLVLDEPTTGLDPLTRRQLWRLLGDLTDRLGVTILVSTHYLEEAEAADNVVLLEDGAVLACGPPQDIIGHAPGGALLWRVRLSHPEGRTGARLHDALVALLTCDDDAPVRDLSVDHDLVTVRLAAPEAVAEALRALRVAGYDIHDTAFVPMTFEEAFVAHLGEARRAAGRSGAPCGHDGAHAGRSAGALATS